MIDMYIMIWHLKILNLKTILTPSIVGGMPLKRIHVVPSLNIECTPWGSTHNENISPHYPLPNRTWCSLQRCQECFP